MFLNDGKGHFKEMPGSRKLFAYKGAGEQGGDNMVCGVCFCDVNRDGLLDLVLGQHYSTPWRQTVPNKLFLNRGIKDGIPVFEDVTEKAGLTPLGKLGRAATLIGCREIATGYGYASGQPAYAHFGLGRAQKADVEVILPHGKGRRTHRGVTANQVLKVKQ